MDNSFNITPDSINNTNLNSQIKNTGNSSTTNINTNTALNILGSIQDSAQGVQQFSSREEHNKFSNMQKNFNMLGSVEERFKNISSKLTEIKEAVNNFDKSEGSDVSQLNNQVKKLFNDINTISDNSTFNNQKLFNGSAQNIHNNDQSTADPRKIFAPVDTEALGVGKAEDFDMESMSVQEFTKSVDAALDKMSDKMDEVSIAQQETSDSLELAMQSVQPPDTSMFSSPEESIAVVAQTATTTILQNAELSLKMQAVQNPALALSLI